MKKLKSRCSLPNDLAQIESISASGNRLSVRLGDGRKFKIQSEDLIELDLYQGRELCPEEVESLMSRSRMGDAYNKALNLLSFRPRSKRELERKLDAFDAEVVHQVTEKLERLALIDDEAFARSWVEQRHGVKAIGKRRLASELFQKGISRELIDEALSEISDDEESAKELVRNRLGRSSNENGAGDEKMKARLYALLVRRGYESGTASRAVREVLGEYDGR